MERKHIQHLYARIGFGISPNELESAMTKSKKVIVAELFNASKKVTPLHINISEFKKITPEKLKDNEVLKIFNERMKEKMVELNVGWIARLAEPKELLREKMTLFWANHFVCRDNNAVFMERYNNTLRKHALGSFRGFVKAISREPAMIKYLNLKQNRKQSPNENFARELMELFTLGSGHYSEEDVKQAARAFTGYDHGFYGTYKLRKLKHDYGYKTFFGRTANFGGDNIIDIILLEKQCAYFLCRKLYKYFVNETVNENHVNAMVSVFYPKYNIERLMRFVFMSDWFYEDEHIGSKIKSPIDFLVGMHKIVPMNFEKPKSIMVIQNVLGQTLLNPPNVAGWEGGKSWINSNSILFRLRLPSILLNGHQIHFSEEGEFKDMYFDSIKRKKSKNYFGVEANWEAFDKNYNAVPIKQLQKYILSTNLNSGTKSFLNGLNRISKRDYCIQLMSLPEYQMC